MAWLKLQSKARNGMIVFWGAARQEFENVAALTDGAVQKFGSTSSRLASSLANQSMIREIYDFALGGEYGHYVRAYVTAAAKSADAVRAFATVEDVAADTVRAIHASLSHAASGTLTGLGAAIEATLHLNSAGGAAGTITPIKAAIHSEAAASDPAGATSIAYIITANQGETDGMADVDDDAVLFHFSGMTAGAGHTIGALGNEPTWTAKTRLIKCRLEGVGLTYLVAVDP